MNKLVKSSNLKEQVLGASISILNRHGYGALCLTSVASELGVSKQRIYYHYTDPETIILQLADEWSKTGQFYTLKALASTELSGMEKIYAIAEGMFDWMEADRDLSKLGLILYQLAPQIKKLNKFMTDARIAGRARMKSFLILNENLKNKAPEILERIVTSIHSHMYGHFFYVIAMNDFGHLQQHRENCRAGFKVLLLNHLKL